MADRVTVGGVVWKQSERDGVPWETEALGPNENGAMAVIVNTGAPEFRAFVGKWWTDETSYVNPVALIRWYCGDLKLTGFEHDNEAMDEYAKEVSRPAYREGAER